MHTRLVKINKAWAGEPTRPYNFFPTIEGGNF